VDEQGDERTPHDAFIRAYARLTAPTRDPKLTAWLYVLVPPPTQGTALSQPLSEVAFRSLSDKISRRCQILGG
jgi:hypothetical protein